MEKFLKTFIEKLEKLWGFLFYKTGPGVLLISGGTTLVASFFIDEGDAFPKFAQPIIFIGVLYLGALILIGIIWLILTLLVAYLNDKNKNH